MRELNHRGNHPLAPVSRRTGNFTYHMTNFACLYQKRFMVKGNNVTDLFAEIVMT